MYGPGVAIAAPDTLTSTHTPTRPTHMDPAFNNLTTLTKALQRAVLTEEQQRERDRKEYFERQNYQATQRVINELAIPAELQKHIPRKSGQYTKLSSEALKEHRKSFSVHKALPIAAKFKTGNRNKKLGEAIKKTADRLQNNSKHTLGAAIEIATDLSKTGKRLRNRIETHTRIPEFLKNRILERKNIQTKDIERVINAIDEEFSKYQETLSELEAIYSKLHSLIFLESDSIADSIQQIKNICLGLRNLQPPKDNIYPTKREFAQAQGDRYRYPYNGGGRRGGRGRDHRYRGRGRGGRGNRYAYPQQPPTYYDRKQNGGFPQ